jgi:hypothetical protein
MASVRKAHVKRVFKIAANPDTGEDAIVTDFFVDMLRIDELPVIFQSTDRGKLGQAIKYILKWNDDRDNPLDNIDASNADAQFENANAKRKTEKKRITDPDVKTSTTELPDGSSNSATSIDDNDILLWIVDRVKIKMPQGKDTGELDQVVQFVFNNIPLVGDEEGRLPGKRTTSVIKIVNNDLAGLKMATDVDADGNDITPKAIIRDWDTYRQALIDGKTDKDDKLFLPVEYTDDFIVLFGVDANRFTQGIIGQAIRHKLTGNRAVENLFEAIDQDIVEKKTWIRLDPLQVIVNVGSNIIAVEFYNYKDEKEETQTK